MAYTAPTPADLKLRYGAFANVADETVQYWLTDGERYVTDTWIESDRAVALIEYAAHKMVKAQVAGLDTSMIGNLAAKGVTDFRSGSFSVSFDPSAAKRRSGEDWCSTDYGAEFLKYLKRNRGGPFASACP